MKRWRIVALTSLTAVFVVGAVTVTLIAANTSQEAHSEVTQPIPLSADTIYRLVNDERMKAGLQPLLRDDRLNATAQARADDMVKRNYFSHYDPATGESLVKIIQTNPECVAASENISWNTPPHIKDDNAEVVRSWMESKPHHDAILRPGYTLTGVAISGDKIVQHFCQQK